MRIEGRSLGSERVLPQEMGIVAVASSRNRGLGYEALHSVDVLNASGFPRLTYAWAVNRERGSLEDGVES